MGGQLYPQILNDWGYALLKLAELTSNKNYVETALDKFEQAITRQSKEYGNAAIDPEWFYNYGCALDFLGDFNEDVTYYEKAVYVLSKTIQLDPTYTDARYNLALALSHLGEATADIEALNRANDHFQILLSQDNEDEMGWNDWGLTLLTLAHLLDDKALPHQSQKLYEQAENKLHHAAALGNIHSFYNLTCLYSLTENYTAAIYSLERAELAGALPSLDDLMHDEWLEGLRQTEGFRHLISQIFSKHEKDK